MAKLQTHSNFESVINPDDQKLSADYNKNRVQEISELATARVNEVSRRRTGNNGGLEGYFENFEDGTLTNPRGLSRQVRNRVMAIVGTTGVDAMRANNGSSASTLDTGLWNYTRTSVLENIENTRSNCLKSLTVLQGYKEAMTKAQAGAFEQFQNMKNRQEEVIENRNWWQKASRRVLKVASLGIYALVERKKRQKFFNNRFEKRMKDRFDELNRNIAKLEKDATSRKDRMKSHMNRVLTSAHSPTRKALLKKELLDAVQNITGDINDVDLPNWTNYAGGIGINDDQEKVDFLEAAKELDFVKKDLAALGISKQKNMEQEEMIRSAQEQQEIMTDSKKFKAFEKITGTNGTKQLSEFENLTGDKDNSPKTTDLVKSIERQLQGQSIDVEQTIYGAAGDIKKSDLMVDSTRLILLINAITEDPAKKAINKSIKVKQSILDWIAKRNLTSANKEERSNPEKTKKFLDTLKGSDQKSGILKETQDLIKESRDLKNMSLDDIENLKEKIEKLSTKITTNQADFEQYENLNIFTKKDFTLLNGLWNKITKSRDFLEKNIEGWVSKKTKITEAKDDLDKNDYLKNINTQIDNLLKGDNSIEKFNKKLLNQLDKPQLSNSQQENIQNLKEDITKLEASLKIAEGNFTKLINNNAGKGLIIQAQQDISSLRSKISSKQEGIASIQGLSSENIKSLRKEVSSRNEQLEKLINKRETFKKENKISEFKNPEELITLANELAKEAGKSYELQLESKVSGNISLADRIQNEFATEDFAEEIDKKFVKELARNDQYETLKTVSEGTTVHLTYKEVGGSSELRFPNQLNGSEVNNFVVFKKEGNAVHLRNSPTGKVITIVSSAANNDGTIAYKNAIVRKASGGTDEIANAVVGGAGEHAIVYNMRIAP